MSEELNGAEFWLPPEFLTEDFFAEKDGEGVDDGGVDGGVPDPCFPTEFPYEWGYGSDLSASPVEDSVAWTESSDEEDYMTGLAQQMLKHSLQLEESEAMAARSNAAMLKRRAQRPQPAPASRHHREACLPQDWTY